MSMETRDKLASELFTARPAALASRVWSGLSAVPERLTGDELPARLQRPFQLLAARIRSALDVPTQGELGELSRRLDIACDKLVELEALGSADDDRASEIEGLRAELRAELQDLVAKARDTAKLAAREEVAQHVAAAQNTVGDAAGDRSKQTGGAKGASASAGKGKRAKGGEKATSGGQGGAAARGEGGATDGTGEAKENASKTKSKRRTEANKTARKR